MRVGLCFLGFRVSAKFPELESKLLKEPLGLCIEALWDLLRVVLGV